MTTAAAERQGFGKQKASTGNLLRVTVQIGDRKYDEDLAVQAHIAPNIESLNEGLETNPSRFAEWAMLEALARSECETIKAQIAKLDTDVKEKEAALWLSVGAGTVDATKARVTAHPERLALVKQRQELDAALLVAEDNFRKIGVGRKTIEEKKDCLLELSRNWRQEMQGRLSVRGGELPPGARG